MDTKMHHKLELMTTFNKQVIRQEALIRLFKKKNRIMFLFFLGVEIDLIIHIITACHDRLVHVCTPGGAHVIL